MSKLRDDRAVTLTLSMRTSTLRLAEAVVDAEHRKGAIAWSSAKLSRALAEILTKVILVKHEQLKAVGAIVPNIEDDVPIRSFEVEEELPDYAIDPEDKSGRFNPRKAREGWQEFNAMQRGAPPPPAPTPAPAPQVDPMALLAALASTLGLALPQAQPQPTPVRPPAPPAPPEPSGPPAYIKIPRVPMTIQNFHTNPERAQAISDPTKFTVDPVYWAPPGTPMKELFYWVPNSENIGRNPILRETWTKAREWCVDPEAAKKRAAEAAGFKEPTDADYERAMNNSLLASFESREKTEPAQSQANSHVNTLDDESEVPGLDAVNAEAAEGIDWSKVP